jgi:WD40 repeat protein/Tfp pilus assembly protein PilF
VARIGVQAAEALAYAHRQGIVHRDVKPSNLLLDTQGVVWLTDFGLVKDEEGDQLTQTGDLVGTVRYMAPERFEGHGDARSDIYGLGATLYELLTLRPAFVDAQRARLIERVLHTDPVRPRRLDPRVPRDLETIVLKALAKEPARRYQTAEDLTEDLRRFLADRPIRARRASAAERTWRWCRRNPVVAALMGFVAMLLVGIAVSSSVLAWRLNREHHDAVHNWEHAEDAKRAARAAEHTAKERLWQSRLAEARAARFGRQPGRRFDGLQALTEAAALARELNVPAERFLELRNEAIACMALTDVRSVRRLEDLAGARLGTGIEPQVAFDGRWEVYARGDPQGNVSVRRVADDREIARFSRPGQVAAHLLFSPDGRYLAAKYYRAHSEQPVGYVVWDWRHAKELLRQDCEYPESPRLDFAFSGDGRQFLVGGRQDGTVRIYNLASGREARRLDLRGETACLALHPDGRRLAHVSTEVTVRRIDTGAVLASWKAPKCFLWALAWHPDGKLLACAGNDRRVYLWDVTTGEYRTLEGHENDVVHVAFNHAGTLLASYGWDGTTRFWDPHSGKELLRVPGLGLQFSPDDRHLAYRKGGDELGIWEVAHERVCHTLYGHGEGLQEVHFSPDGRLLASAGQDGVRLWGTAAARQAAALPLGRTLTALFHPRGDSLITSGNRGLYRWPLRSAGGTADRHLRLGPCRLLDVPVGERLEHASIDREGRRLAVVDFWRKAIVLDLDDPGVASNAPAPGHRLLESHERVTYVALSPDGRWAATGAFKGSDVKVWDLAQKGQARPVHTIPCGWASVTFSPDGHWLVVSTDDENRFYRVGSWTFAQKMGGKRSNVGVAFGENCPFLAVRCDDGRHLALLDPETGRELATLMAQDAQQIGCLAMSTGGRRLAAGMSSGAVQLWDLRAVRWQLHAMGLDWDPPSSPADAGAGAEPVTIQIEGVIPRETPAQRQSLNAQLVLWSLSAATMPLHYDPYHQRGHVYEQLGQPEQAAADFAAAICRQPGNPKQLSHLHTVRGDNLLRLKRYAEGVADLQRALTYEPNNAQACNNLAWFYVTGPVPLRDPRRALPLAERAVAAGAGHGNCLNTLGVVHYRLGNYRKAVETLQRDLRETKEESPAFDWFFLAMSHWRLREPSQARNYFDRAVQWVHERQATLTPAWREELDRFRAEAEEVMTGR